MCALSTREVQLPIGINDGIGKPITNLQSKAGLSYEDMLTDDFVFDMDSHDVMVFLHMQKTGYLHIYRLLYCNNRIYLMCGLIVYHVNIMLVEDFQFVTLAVG